MFVVQHLVLIYSESSAIVAIFVQWRCIEAKCTFACLTIGVCLRSTMKQDMV